MDYQLVLLLGLIAAVFIVAFKHQMWTVPMPGRPGNPYQRVISFAAVGLLFTVSGVIGWDLSHSRGWFQGTKWVDGPIWWQVGLGTGLLMLAGFWARRMPARR